MGVVTMTINGTDVMPYVRDKSLEITHYLNARPVCTFALNTKGNWQTYRPAITQPVVVVDAGTRVFGGIVYTTSEQPVIHDRAKSVKVDCVGYEFFADKALYNGIVAAGTLKSQMTAIVGNVGHSVIVDPSQGNGPAMPVQGFPFSTCKAALDQLSVVSGWVYKFDHFGNVLMFQPGTVGAPFALTDSNSTMTRLTVQGSLQDYINSIWIQFGSTQVQQVTSVVNGDSSTRLFPLGYNVSTPPATLIEHHSGVDTVFPVGIYGVDSTDYLYRQDDPFFPYAIVQQTTRPVLGPSDYISATFNAQFPGALQVNNASEITAHGAYAKVITAPDVYDRVVAQAIAQGELDRVSSMIRTITIETVKPGIEPGMTVNVTSTDHDVSGVSFLVTVVKMRHMNTGAGGKQTFKYEITGIEGNSYRTWASNWAQYFRSLGAGGGSAGGTTVGGGGTVSAPSTVPYAFWGGSRSQGVSASGVYKDVRDVLPVRITGNGQPVTVRVFQATSNAATNVQARILKVGGSTMATSATTVNVRNPVDSSNFGDQFLTFTPDPGVNDYVLQVKGGGPDAVFAIGVSV